MDLRRAMSTGGKVKLQMLYSALYMMLHLLDTQLRHVLTRDHTVSPAPFTHFPSC